MSLATQVTQAINAARIGLGDLVVPATLKSAQGRVYDAASGKYVTSFDDVPVQGVLDKFDYTEQLGPDFNQNDLKFNVFNPLNSLIITTADSLELHGVNYPIHKILRTYVGTLVPVFTLYLRK